MIRRKDLVGNAKELRKNMTKAEEMFWRFVRDRGYNGIKFRRQHPIGSFVLDFYWAEKKVCVEVDGGVHDTRDAKEYDKERSHLLNENGIRVIRFRNEEILENIGSVLRKVVEFGESPQH